MYSRHVDADHRVLGVEHELRQRARELGLADARRAEEQERADRAVGVLQARARAAQRRGDRLDRLVLADDAFVQALLHVDSFSVSPSSRRLTGMPVQRATTSATSSASTSSLRNTGAPRRRLGAIRAGLAAPPSPSPVISRGRPRRPTLSRARGSRRSAARPRAAGRLRVRARSISLLRLLEALLQVSRLP